jgi:hypothetical protein
MDEQDILEAARAIRPHLPELVSNDEASELTARLDQLLDQAAAGEDVQVQVLILLGERAATREWARRLLDVPPRLRHYQALPGHGQLAAVPRYACPDGCPRYWYRFSRADEVPLCEKHKVPLEPSP